MTQSSHWPYGKGVPRHYAAAAKWYRMAAEQGYTAAQRNRGALYYAGSGMPQNYIRAHRWFNLAAAQGDVLARHYRKNVATEMTPADISNRLAVAGSARPRKHEQANIGTVRKNVSRSP